MAKDSIQVQPLQRAGHYTILDNLFFDYIMPKMTGSAWKVFSFLLRQTKGWQRDSASPSYRDIRKGTGIKSNTTVQKALEELAGLNLVCQETGGGPETNTYTLNREYTVTLEPNNDGTYRAADPNRSLPYYQIRVPMQHLQRAERGGSIRGLREAQRLEILSHTKKDKKIALLRFVCMSLFDKEHTPAYNRFGAWVKHVGSAERCLDLLWRYNHADVDGNALHYIMGAEKRRREQGEQWTMPQAPEHLGQYPIDERNYLISKGYEKERFKQCNRDERGDPIYLYVDPNAKT